MTKEERDDRRRSMFSLIRKFEVSQMSARAFYHQHQLAEHIFYYWLKKYKEDHSPVENGFLPVEVGSPVLSPANESNDGVHILYPNGVSVTLDKSVSISRLKALITVI